MSKDGGGGGGERIRGGKVRTHKERYVIMEGAGGGGRDAPFIIFVWWYTLCGVCNVLRYSQLLIYAVKKKSRIVLL